jgi:hypothetical protein
VHRNLNVRANNDRSFDYTLPAPGSMPPPTNGADAPGGGGHHASAPGASSYHSHHEPVIVTGAANVVGLAPCESHPLLAPGS